MNFVESKQPTRLVALPMISGRIIKVLRHCIHRNSHRADHLFQLLRSLVRVNISILELSYDFLDDLVGLTISFFLKLLFVGQEEILADFCEVKHRISTAFPLLLNLLEKALQLVQELESLHAGCPI